MTMASAASARTDIHHSGEPITEVGPGSLYCVGCGYAVSTVSPGELPECPACGGNTFQRSGSIFERPPAPRRAAVENPAEAHDWLDEARAELDQAGTYLAFDEGDGEFAVIRLETGWTRIGRSRTADLRLDDSTVSRRHALVVLSPGGKLRALDDRSLNGLYVNGERVEWAVLEDGDELEVGRFRLHVLEA
jgi:predicted  nucleic acid-binding Zn-ribbon protein